jgi:hypothetical protein
VVEFSSVAYTTDINSSRLTGIPQAIIGTVARHRLTYQRHAQWIERCHHGFELSQVRTMIFAVPLVQKTLVVHRVVIDTHTRTVEAHGIGGQAVHAYPTLEHRPIEARLSGFIAQHAQHIGKTIIGTIGGAQGGVEKPIEGHDTLRHPIAYGDQAMVTLSQDMA